MVNNGWGAFTESSTYTPLLAADVEGASSLGDSFAADLDGDGGAITLPKRVPYTPALAQAGSH